jgi:hypothetical protein
LDWKADPKKEQQCDQIGLIFALWVIVYFGQVIWKDFWATF